MALIYETEYFIIESREPPHMSRADGGHIVISPKVPLHDRTEMTASQAKEFIKLSMVAGEAMKKGMGRQGIEIGRINYQDNGNFNVKFHLHLYGRAVNAPTQPFGTTMITPRTKAEFVEYIRNLEPLLADDIAAIREEIEILMESEKYQEF